MIRVGSEVGSGIRGGRKVNKTWRGKDLSLKRKNGGSSFNLI